ncbi:MAG: flagellar biosynthesis protein FlhA [Acidobacteriaceae bacterium]
MNKKRGLLETLKASSDWIIPTGAVALVFVMLVPLPSFVLDLLLTFSIMVSVLVLLTAIQILRPVQFSVFPSLILLLTLMRLSLDLACTRRILLHGNEGSTAAGKVIEAFGQFVVGGNYIVGFVIFLALIAIQYLVVSHGAVRTAEVTARFTLDAMPGKQMAIDSDLNTGLINAEQARTRREQVAREAEFCGSMDGAARFSQRDSLATILVLTINIVAGFLIGVFQQGIPFQQALKTYTILTVGNGLVSIIPSLLVSVAGGIVVTRAGSDLSLGEDIGKQMFKTSRPLWIVSAVLLGLALIPGMPKLSFLVLGGVTMFAAWKMKPSSEKESQATAKAATAKAGAAGASAVDPMDAVLKLDDLMLEVGVGLVPLVDAKQGGQLLARVKSLRKNLAQQLGFLVPSIHITDNLSLKEKEYVIYLRGVEIARWEMRRDRLLAVNSNPKPGDLQGQETREPAFDSPAKWIAPDLQAQAIASGYAVVDHTAVLAAHLAEVIKQNAQDLLSRHETKRLVDRLSDSHPKLVEELMPKLMSLGEIQKVLQQLLREQVSIRDLGTILEALVEAAAVNKSPIALVEAARHSLGRALIRPLLDDSGQLKVVTLDRSIEEECARTTSQQSQPMVGGAMQVSVASRVMTGLRAMLGDQFAAAPPVLLCSSPGRFYLKRLLDPFLPRVVVISPSEIPPMTQVQSLGSVR